MSLEDLYTEAFDNPLAAMATEELGEGALANIMVDEEVSAIAEALGMAHGYLQMDWNEVLPVLEADWPFSESAWNLFRDVYAEAYSEGRQLKKDEENNDLSY